MEGKNRCADGITQIIGGITDTEIKDIVLIVEDIITSQKSIAMAAGFFVLKVLM